MIELGGRRPVFLVTPPLALAVLPLARRHPVPAARSAGTAPDRGTGRTKKPPPTAYPQVGGGCSVEPRGVEPLTSAMQRQRSTN